MSTDLEGKVAIVTGGGGALGSAYARALAARGVAVIVNDYGGDIRGEGDSRSPADETADAIRSAGGTAAANYESVENGESIVESALDTFGRLDIVVNNAGILRDVSFHKMAAEDWDAIYRVHLLGTFRVCRAAWPHLRNQEFGRIVNTGSAAGLYGNFGQTNYAAMKLGVHGLTMSLAREGIARNVLVNTVAPAALSRLTLTVLPKEQLKLMSPELVAPLVTYLCDPNCSETGGLFEVGGGWIGKLRWQRTRGVHFGPSSKLTSEMVGDRWEEITSFENAPEFPESMEQAFAPYAKVMSGEIR